MIKPRVLNKRKLKPGDEGVYVGRPSKWGNYPALVEPPARDRNEAVERFRQFCDQNEWFRDQIKAELKGRNLICWCWPANCHASILLEIANDEPRGLRRFFKRK